MGGQQPVAGVTIQLYQAGTTGYGSAATPLGSPTLTNSSGNFSLPTPSCAPGSQVFLLGTGGQPIAATGNSPAVTNNNLAMMVGLGTCGGPNLNTFVNVNELTTIATVWALAPFMTSPTDIGAPASNAAGLANAFAVINQLVATSTGNISGPTLPAGATLPIAEINTLADILEECVNSGGTASSSSSCTTLFSLAPNAAGNTPTDTITAALNIAQNPARNVAALNRLRNTSPVFTPALNVNSPPTSFTIAITYAGGGLSSPTALAVDAASNLWITNAGNNSVSKLDPTGAPLSGASGFTAGSLNNPSGIAIDPAGNAWITNAGNNTLTELNPAGTSATIVSGNGLNLPRSIAIDGTGNIFVANSATVSAFAPNGTPLNAASPYTNIAAPLAVAITPR